MVTDTVDMVLTIYNSDCLRVSHDHTSMEDIEIGLQKVEGLHCLERKKRHELPALLQHPKGLLLQPSSRLQLQGLSV